MGGWVIFALFFCRLKSRRLHGFRRFFGFSFEVCLCLNFPPEAGVFLFERFHLFSVALLQICYFLLHLHLAV